MKKGKVVKWAFDVTDTRESCKEAPTTAADHAKKTPAYDKTPDAIMPTSDGDNGIKGMLEAYGEAEQYAQPDKFI